MGGLTLLCIVIHHVPSFQYTNEEFKRSLLNCTIYSNIENLIHLYNPEYWIYWHFHRNISDLEIGKTVLLSNQLGYVIKAEYKKFNRSALGVL